MRNMINQNVVWCTSPNERLAEIHLPCAKHRQEVFLWGPVQEHL